MTRPSVQRQLPAAYEFGAFRLEPTEQRLIYGEQPIPLPHRAFDMLVYLVERSGHLVTKEELLAALWPGLFVEESNLSQNVFLLRRALTNGASGHEYIETVPRRGYRFAVPVREVFAEPPPAGETAPPSPSAGVDNPRRRPARALLAVGLAVGLAVLVAAWFWTARRATPPIVGVRSIAVLPLTMLGPRSADGYLGLGLADAVTTRLGYVRRLLVRPTASIRALNAESSEPLAAGRALRVDAVLAGQIQKAGGRVRVTAQLISVSDGATLWSEKFDVKEADLFTLEDSVSEAVARALTSSLSAGETRRVGRDRPTSPEAYEAYLQGRYFWNQRSEPATRKARTLFSRAIALDPGYALAYAGLADALHYFPDPGDLPRSREVARKALELDDSLAEAHASLGNLSLFTDWNFEDAERRFQRALDLNPSYATAHQWYAYCFLVRGDLVGASGEIRRAQEADPLSPSIGVDAALMLYYARRYDDAVAALHRVLDLDPRFGQALQYLPIVFVTKGDIEAATQACSPPTLSADAAVVRQCLALVAAHAGDRSRANGSLSGITGPERWVSASEVAAALGDRDVAFEQLEEGYRLRSASMLLLGADPLFDSLRGDARFEDLLRRIGIRSTSS